MSDGVTPVQNSLTAGLFSGHAHPPRVTDAVGAVTHVVDHFVKAGDVLASWVAVFFAIADHGEVTARVVGWRSVFSGQRHVVVAHGVNPVGATAAVRSGANGVEVYRELIHHEV